jgi:hypothetical protein
MLSSRSLSEDLLKRRGERIEASLTALTGYFAADGVGNPTAGGEHELDCVTEGIVKQKTHTERTRCGFCELRLM